MISAGSIIPDASDFFSYASPFIDGAFFAQNGDAISENGVFFSIEAEILREGHGSLAFDFTSGGTLAAAFSDIDDGQGLNFATASAADFTSPEPSSAVLLLSVLAGVPLAWRVLRRRRIRANLIE